MKHTARKRFGQNFLHDEQIIARIVRLVQKNDGQRIVEIGPGQAALTRHLLPLDDNLVVVEIDRDLAASLGQQFSHCAGLRIMTADALTVDFSALAIKENKKLYIVGNLPYNISTPLIFHLISHGEYIAHMLFMLQKEVVQRMCALPGNKDYGRLSVMIQYYFSVEKLFDVPPQAFRPAPQVTSSIVRLKPHEHITHPASNPAFFAQVVAAAFGQRRKTLRNSLREMTSENELLATGIDPQLRADNVALSQFVDISNFLYHKRRVDHVT